MVLLDGVAVSGTKPTEWTERSGVAHRAGRGDGG
jgi:hypothetical protein